MKAPHSIETARLKLVRPNAGDAADMFERYAGDADVTRYVGWPRHHAVSDTEAFLKFSEAEWEQWPAGPYLIRSRDDGRLLGSTGFGFNASNHAITGYVLARDSWGAGYATEALMAMIDLAPTIGIARLTAFCHPEHRASWRVLEKCGFTRDINSTEQAEFPNLAPDVKQSVFRYELAVSRTD